MRVFEAPSTATNTCAARISPVAGSVTSTVCPAKSTNSRSPAGWTCRIVGDRLRARADERRATEVDVAVHALNRMLELGRPESVRIA